MLNPWHILGWLFVLTFSMLLIGLSIALANYYRRRWWYNFSRLLQHYKTRNIEPEEGQTWIQRCSYTGSWVDVLHIHDVLNNGNVIIKHGQARWMDTSEDWRDRVRERKLYLEQ